MSTTLSNFVAYTGTAAVLEGVSVTPGPFVFPVGQNIGPEIVQGAGGALISKLNIDLATAGYAKNGAALLTLSGSTAITIDLTALAAATGVTIAGDTAFAIVYQLVLTNLGTHDVTIAPGASNPAPSLLAGTSPTLTIPAGSSITLQSVAGLTIDSTHKTFTVTPTAGGQLGIAVGGA